MRVMAGDYAVEDLPRDVTSKDTVDSMRTAWWVEVTELASMQRAQLDDFKSFVSRRVDRVRLPYERETRDFPRRCVLVGTTNEAAYLQDATGNRRFWPVRVGSVDLPRLERDREQLYAEAAREWRADPRPELLVLPSDLWPTAAAEQEARVVADPWIDRVASFLGGRTNLHEVASAELLGAIGVKPEQQTTGHARRLAVAMHALGWEPAQVGPRRLKGYRRRSPR